MPTIAAEDTVVNRKVTIMKIKSFLFIAYKAYIRSCKITARKVPWYQPV